MAFDEGGGQFYRYLKRRYEEHEVEKIEKLLEDNESDDYHDLYIGTDIEIDEETKRKYLKK